LGELLAKLAPGPREQGVGIVVGEAGRPRAAHQSRSRRRSSVCLAAASAVTVAWMKVALPSRPLVMPR
jgi:hypothetical protein